MMVLKTGASIRVQAATKDRVVIPRKQVSKGALKLLFMQWRKAREASKKHGRVVNT